MATATYGINYDSATGASYDVPINSDVTITSNTDGYADSTWQYLADNGVYNVGSMVNGTNFAVSLTLDPATFPNGVNFSWSFPVRSYWDWDVYAMPNIKYFLQDASGNNTFTQVASLNLNANYSVQISGNTAQTDVAFDMFFYSSPSYGTPVAEVEVVVHSPWTGFGSNEPFSVTVPGLANAEVLYETGGGWPLIMVSTTSDVLSDSISLSGVLKTLASHGLISAQDYIGDVRLGSEVAGGTGGLDVQSLSYTSTAGSTPSSTSTAGSTPSSTSTAGSTPSSTSTAGSTPSSTSTAGSTPSSTSTAGSTPSSTSTAKTGSSGATSTGSSGVTSIGSSDPTPATPTISSFSPDNGKASGGYTTAHVLTVTGVAAANSKVEVFNGSAQLGTTTANGSGAWSFTTPSLSNGAQSFTAKDVNSAGKVSAASTALNLTVVTDATLNKAGNNYTVTSTTSDPVLKYKGANVTAGEFGAWTPIGAVQTATGYDIAWKNTGTGQYTVWTTDNNGNYTGSLIGAVSGNSYAWESIAPIFPQNLNGGGVTGPVTKVIQKDGSTSLTEVANQFHLDDTSGSDPALRYKGANVTAGEFGGWTPIGAVKTASGYDIAWKNTSTGQYTVWSTDSNGNYTRSLTGAVAGTSYALESLEPVFKQDLNHDGVIGPTTKVIQKDGSTSLTEVANQFYLDNTSGSDPALKYKGANVTAGEFGGWTPIGAVKTASGYDIAWKNSSTGQYTVWTTNSNGNYTRSLTGTVAVAGTSYALESLEPVFKQDLNHDGVIGPTTKVIQKDGSTSLTEVANQFYLDNTSGSDPALKYKGANVTAGEFGGWTPIGAVKTASGYDIAWKNTVTGQYTVWSTDSNGNYTRSLTGTVAGTSYALESLEPVFKQDLNHDGVIGPTTKVIQKDGSTSLTEVANQFYLDGSSGSDPALKYKGANVTAGEFGGWTPIGAVKTARGYDIAWKNTSTGQYTVWTTNSNGNYTRSLTGAVAGTSYALESLEAIFGQDLNGDKVIGLYAAPNAALKITSSLAGSSGLTKIGAGATLDIAAADSASVTFQGTTGTLRLDQPSTFSGEIFGFKGNGTLSGSDHIDLRNIKYGSVHDSYANGILTVSDGYGDTDKLRFNGSYTLANFKFASDGSGGTIVYDPPVSGQNTAGGGPVLPSATTDMGPVEHSTGTSISGFEAKDNIDDLPSLAFDAQSTLGYLPNGNRTEGTLSLADGIHSANIALLGNYVASIFAIGSVNHGGATPIAEIVQPNDHSVLSNPHHA